MKKLLFIFLLFNAVNLHSQEVKRYIVKQSNFNKNLIAIGTNFSPSTELLNELDNVPFTKIESLKWQKKGIVIYLNAYYVVVNKDIVLTQINQILKKHTN